MIEWRWVDIDENEFEHADVGFLLEISHDIDGSGRYELRGHPAISEYSGEPMLHGDCGSRDSVSTRASGMARIERRAENGRAFVHRLNSGEVLYALQALGYAELLDQAGNEEFDKHWK